MNSLKRFARKKYGVLMLGTIVMFLMFCISPGEGDPVPEQKMIEDITKLLLSEISKLSSRVTYLEQQNKTLSRMITNLMEEQSRGSRLLPEQVQEHLVKMYTLPKVVSFCNERVPLEKWDIGKRLDSEFTTFLIDEKQVILWLKRMGEFFPYIEEELEKAGLPDDLKYIAIVESGLRARAESSAGAVGFWQFIKTTGNGYGLEQNAWLDNRRDIYASTKAAIKYLKNLNDLFHDWPLAMAAYNCGEGRVQNAMRDQRVHNYYQLELPRETERYVFKIIAAKIILSDPKKYGFYFDERNIFSPYPVEQVQVTLKKATSLRDLAERYGSYYREIRLLNPEIDADTLPPGTYTIKVPKGWQQLAAVPESQAPQDDADNVLDNGNIVYTVRSGDSLKKIAQQFQVDVTAIKKVKGDDSSLSKLQPGEKLLILK